MEVKRDAVSSTGATVGVSKHDTRRRASIHALHCLALCRDIVRVDCGSSWGYGFCDVSHQRRCGDQIDRFCWAQEPGIKWHGG